jgi:hypothetical protein
MTKRLHRSIFLEELKALFPQLTQEINAEYGLLHLEMHVFAKFAQQAIMDGDVENVRLCFNLADKYHNEGTAKVINAIVVSFVEHLNLQKAQWAWELLTPSLREAYLACVDAGTAAPLPYVRERR